MHVKRERGVSEDTPPDWGDDDSPSGSPESTDDDDGDDDMQLSQWPWGPGGRPSDNDGATGRLTEKPNEPAGEPATKKARVNTATEKPREPEGELPRRGLPQDPASSGKYAKCKHIWPASGEVRRVPDLM